MSLIGQFTTTETNMTCGYGNYVMTLDNSTGFNTGWVVQIFSNIDSSNYMIGIIAQGDNDGSGNITVATFYSTGAATGQSWSVQLIAGPQSAVNPYSATTVDITNMITVPSLGTIVTFQVEPNKAFNNYSTVYCTPQLDYKSWFIGVVLNYDIVGGVLNVFCTNTSNTGVTQCPWTITLLDNSSVDADLIGFASDTLTPTAGSQITFTTATAGKFFPIQGNILIDDLTPTVNNHYVGTVAAYTGNTLIVNVSAAFGTGTASSSWGLYLIAGPQTRIPLFGIAGLYVNQIPTAPAASFGIQAGTVRDYTDTVDLTLSSYVSINLSSVTNISQALQAGTISNVGTAITGIGTTFTTDFFSGGGSTCFLADYNAQLGKSSTGGSFNITVAPLISTGTATARVSSVADDLDLTTDVALASAGVAFYRGGPVSTINTPTGGMYYGIGLAYNSTTGAISVFATSFTPSGQPDLPTGCVYYRIIAIVNIYYNGATYTATVSQPLNPLYAVNSPSITVGGVVQVQAPIFDSQWYISTALANGTTATTQAATDNSTNVATTAYVNTKTVGANLQASPSFNTSNSTTTMRMMGYGSLCTLTPVSTGNIVFTFDGATQVAGTRVAGVLVQAYHGTGSAASTGAAVTGTIIGPTVTYGEAISTGDVGFSQTRLITGQTSGTAIWFDLAVSSGSSGAAATMANINFLAKES